MPANRPVSSMMSTCTGAAPQSIFVPAPRGTTVRSCAAASRSTSAAACGPPGTATQRARANERRDWLQALWSLRGQGRSLEDAVALTRTQAAQWPTLAAGGKGGQGALRAANARRWLKALGASFVREGDGYTVLKDIEGNNFCVVAG